MNHPAHFGLREPAFGITPDTTFFFPCRSAQEALNTLLIALENGEGFIKITGEVGTGKTLLCRKFLSTLDEKRWVSAYITNPSLEPRTLLLAFAEELSATVEPGVDQHRLLKSITRTLLELATQGKRVVLCLDESQAMPLETLETLRLLTNLETEKRKLLQVVLFGQPELDEKLAHESVRQLRQRITFQHRLGALSREETEAYLRHRLAVAGYNGEPLFTTPAARAVHRASRGVPRLVNVLANKAMMLAYGQGTRRVRWSHVRSAVEDTPSAHAWTTAWVWLTVFCLAGTTLGWKLLR